MSISGDLLTAATPARLLCRKGIWILELVKLVPVDRNVFQPRVQRLEGSEAILQHFKRNTDNPALAAAAAQLIRGFRADEERWFEAVDGDWVPGDPSVRRDSARPSSRPPGGSVPGELAELRAELLVLRASHERLRERVMRLESLCSTDGVKGRDLISVVPLPSLGLPRVSDLSASPAQARAPTAADAPRPQARVPNLNSKPASAAAVRLPAAPALDACLRAATAEQVSAHEKRPAAFSPGGNEPRWVSRLIDEEGREVGAIVADLRAATALGATLMGLEEAEVEAQCAARTPSEDVIGAMSEVANNLSGTINQEPAGVQVRVKPIEPFTPSLLEWAGAPAQVLELELEPSGGRLFLLAR